MQNFHRKGLAILRPIKNQKSGTITLLAEAEGLETGDVIIKVK